MNVKINNPEAVQDLAKRINAAAEETERQNSAEFNEFFQRIQEFNLTEEDARELNALFNLPDSEFALLAPAFLAELEKEYKDPNTQALLVRTLNASGATVESIQQEYVSLCAAIDELPNEVMSGIKRNYFKQILGAVYNSIARMDGLTSLMVNVPIEKCDERARIPEYAHLTDSGLDVFALEDVTIAPGETKLVPLGIKVAIPQGYEIQVRPKSGRCLKTKLRIANTPGTIDAGYRDELAVIVENVEAPIKDITYDFIHGDSDHERDYLKITSIEYGKSYTIGAGEKFAQLVLAEVPKILWIPVDKVGDIGEDRGGGFGSSGLK